MPSVNAIQLHLWVLCGLVGSVNFDRGPRGGPSTTERGVNVTTRLTALQRLQLLLVAVALHSAGVGAGLIWHPAALLASCGFAPIGEPFFVVQGGIFHLVMAVGYLLAARDPARQAGLVNFTILVKIMAFVFLTVYWLFFARVLTILASGLVDGAMALVIFGARQAWRREARAGGS